MSSSVTTARPSTEATRRIPPSKHSTLSSTIGMSMARRRPVRKRQTGTGSKGPEEPGGRCERHSDDYPVPDVHLPSPICLLYRQVDDGRQPRAEHFADDDRDNVDIENSGGCHG